MWAPSIPVPTLVLVVFSRSVHEFGEASRFSWCPKKLNRSNCAVPINPYISHSEWLAPDLRTPGFPCLMTLLVFQLARADQLGTPAPALSLGPVTLSTCPCASSMPSLWTEHRTSPSLNRRTGKTSVLVVQHHEWRWMKISRFTFILHSYSYVLYCSMMFV